MAQKLAKNEFNPGNKLPTYQHKNIDDWTQSTLFGRM
jgi:hypothetical protein